MLRRLGEPVSRRAVAVGLGLVFVLFAPVLGGGRVLLPLDLLASSPPFGDLPRTERPANPLQSDLVTTVTPALAEVRGALRRGEWPLWSPSVGAGESLLGRPAAQVMQPLQLAGLVLPLERSAGLVGALKVFLCFLFTFLFLRRLALGATAALLGAIAFALSSFVVQWLGWPTASAAVWLPALLLAIDRAVAAESRPRDLGLMATSVFALATTGDGEASCAVGVVAGAYGLLRLGDRLPAERPRGLVRLVLAALVGLALASPVVLARQAELTDSATRARLDRFVEQREREDPLGLVSFDTAGERAGYFADLARRLLPSVAPDALGNSRAGSYWGASNSNEDGGGFASTAVLLLALCGVVLPGGGERPREARFFALVLAGAVALVARPPLLVEVADAFASPSLHRHGLLVAAFALATLGARAFERVSREGLGRPRAVVAVSLAVVGFLVWAYHAHPHPSAPAGDPAALESLRNRTLALQLTVLAVATAALLAARRRPVALLLIPLAAGVELVLLGLPVNRSGLAEQYFPTPPALNFVLAHAAPGERMVGLGNSLPPALSAIYGLADVRVIGTDHPAFYTQLIGVLTPKRQGRFDLVRTADHPLLDLLGVRYVLAPPGTSAPPGLSKIFDDASATVLERPGALPRIFLPATADVYDAKSGPWERWTATNPDFRAKSVVRASLDGARQWRAFRPARATAEMTFFSSTRLGARVETGEPRLVATSIFADPGWRVLINGRPVATTLANGPLLALWVPTGRHDLELIYRPFALSAGLAWAALGLALGSAFLFRPTGRLR